MGLLLLLFFAAGLTCLLGAAAVVYALRHPPRRTYASALARGLPTDPLALGLDFRDASFQLSDHTRTPGWRVRGRSPHGPRLIVIHGYGNSRYGALAGSALLADHASEMVLFDLPGQGESQATASGAGEREVDDVLAVLQQVEAEPSPFAEHAMPGRAAAPGSAPPVVLVGYSMGATIALAVAAQAGERIAGVIAEAPYRRWAEPVRGRLRRARYPRWPIVWLTGLMLRLLMPRMAKADGVQIVARITGPVLILHGDADAICPLDSVRAMAAACPRGQLVEFPGVGHQSLAAADPVRYRAAVARFFEQLNER